MQQPLAFKIEQLPSKIDFVEFLDAFSGNRFIVCHDLKGRNTFIMTEADSAKESVERAVKGAILSCIDYSKKLESPVVVIPFTDYSSKNTEIMHQDKQVFYDMYDILGGEDSLIMISFMPTTEDYLRRVKDSVEHELSSRKVRFTKFDDGITAGSRTGSAQLDLYYGSDERRMLLSMVNTVNEAYTENCISYRISVIISNPSEKVMQYIKSRVSVLESFSSSSFDIASVYNESEDFAAVPFSRRHSATILGFSNKISRRDVLPTFLSDTEGGIILGSYLDGGLCDTGEQVRMQKQNLNLGLILAGLPGTGKSFAAMGILRQSFIGEKPMSIVISPTEEWNGFGKTAGMEVVRIYDHNVRLNFLKCEDGVNKEKFYENLAMLMASASGAGPYREPMEKCLLAAFRRVYSLCTDPDPLYVYEEIENAVIDRHAKRTAAGVKYTKHGENIMAGLENLRQMLFKPQFAYQGGMNFRQLLEKGVVFDLSPVSNTMKPFFYALILNQAYGFADTFDVHGDQSLRMFICIEEAQLIFDNEEQSAANRDLKQRIQDFRKRGVCLAMLTHSANDIEISIRRLCQTKLYFRQSTESARYAAADLLFGQDVNDDIIDSLKKLRQQTCIASYMTIKNGSKEPSSSVFIRPLLVNISDAYKPDEIKAYAAPATGIRILSREGVGLHNTIEVFYAGEKIYKGVPDSEGRVCIEGLLKDKRYKVAMYGAKKKDTRFFDAYGGTDNVITVDIGSD